MWFIFALLSAVVASVRRANDKKLSHKLNAFTLGWAIQLYSLPVILIVLLLSAEGLNPLNYGPKFWIPTIIVWFGFYPISSYLYAVVTRHGELSRMLPLQSIGPVFSLALGILFVNQRPSSIGLVALAIILFGVYSLDLRGKKLHNPIPVLFHDRASRLALVNVALISVVALLDKIAINASGPVFYSFVSTVGAVPVLFATARLFKVSEWAEIRKQQKSLQFSGIFFGASYTTYSLALAAGPLAYVAASRSSLLLVLGSAIGILHFKERLTQQKITAVSLILMGSILLAVAG